MLASPRGDITYIPPLGRLLRNRLPGNAWLAASSISAPSWTGSPAGFCPGGCRSRLETAFCIEAVEKALARHGKPDIFNTDQGSQFTSIDFTAVLKKAEIAISMDGKGAWRDNVFPSRRCKHRLPGNGRTALAVDQL